MINILYFGFYNHFVIEKDLIYFIFKNKYNFKLINEKHNNIEEEFINTDIIYLGSYLREQNNFKLICKYSHKVILFINEPIQYNNILTYYIYINNIIKLSIGTVPENDKNIKFPLYYFEDILNNMDINDNIYTILLDIINNSNKYTNNISINDLLNKSYCCLINRHDMENTRKNIFYKLNTLRKIICPSELFNNFPNEVFEKIGKDKFQNQFIFCICSENFITDLDGYVTEKLWNACKNGNIPIYYGKLDEYEKKIFNMNRILLYDPISEESMNNIFNIVKDLLENPNKLYDFYKQPIFLDTAFETIQFLINNGTNRIEKYINNLVLDNNFKILNYQDLLNYKINIKPNINISNIIFTLSISYELLKSNEFQLFIDNLNNQIIKPKYILIHVQLIEDNIKPYTIINNNYPNLIINCYKNNNNYSLLQNIFLFNNINDDDKIIFLSETLNYNINLILMYELGYQLYNCDGIIINNNNNNNSIYYDNYQDNLDINLSYSFTYKSIKNIKINNLSKSLDELLYDYYNEFNLYIIGINIFNNINTNIDRKNINYNKIFNIQSNIKSRYLLYNIDNINLNYNENKHIDIKYYNDNIIIVTITYFTENININDQIIINNKTINIKNNNLSNKLTFFIYTNIKINCINHNTYNYDIIQINNTNNINLFTFYSIMTILNSLPDINYKFINDIDIYNIINNNALIYNFYNKINNTLLKLNLFVLWYLYNNCGIYININYISDNNLFNELNKYNELIEQKYIFNKIKENINIKKYIVYICKNIYDNNNNNNLFNSLDITINNNNLFNEIKINYSNINGIDHIVWINLDRSINRRKYMENILDNIDIPNTRISAIDGRIIDLTSFINIFNATLQNVEKACVLSHFKAINYLNNIDGNYFLVCEDDIHFNNINLFNYDLKYIIDNAPDFDILLLCKINYNNKKLELYNKWCDSIYSTACYIVSRNYIKKNIDKLIKYINEFKLKPAENFIFDDVNTYIYKYNYIDILNEDSTLHPEHLSLHKKSSEYELNTIINDFI